MGKAPTWRAGANLGKAMAGAGILAQPSVAHALGLGWWFVAWTAAMGISGYTMYLVSRSKISADEIAGPAPHTLSDLTLKITKNARCARAVEALVCVLQMSFGVGYVVVMLSLVCRALVPSLARWAACLALAPLAGCLALIPDLDRLTPVSVFGLFVTIFGVVGLSGGYALTSDDFEVRFWGAAGPGTPSCSWGVLEEARPGRELADRVAAMEEHAPGAVDVGDGAPAGRRRREAGVERVEARRRVELGDVDAGRAGAPAHEGHLYLDRFARRRVHAAERDLREVRHVAEAPRRCHGLRSRGFSRAWPRLELASELLAIKLLFSERRDAC